MPFASKDAGRTWLFIAIISVTAVSVFGSGEKRFDLRIGFDLTQGNDGGPSLRIRDFEDSGDHHRLRAEEDKDDDGGTETKPTERADSLSNSDEAAKEGDAVKNVKRERKSSKEKDSSADKSDDDSDGDSGDDNKRSTKGMRVDEYEPEEHVKSHKQKEDDNDDDGSNDSDKLRRRKRFAFFRRKGKSRE